MQFSPDKWAGLAGPDLALLALGALHMGLIGNMLDRHEIYLEGLLSQARKDQNGSRRRDRPS
jgi:hypothetical protein